MSLPFFGLSILFYAGLFLSVGEVSNMVGVALTVPISKRFGKKSTFIYCNIALAVLSVLFFFLPADSVAGLWGMMVMQILISIFTGIISPLVWSMYADVSDYAELKFNTASTGLIFSSASMAQKFGGAIGGASVMWLLAAIGYIQPQAGEVVTQPAAVVQYLWYLMTFVPCCVALLSIIVVNFYPLTTEEIESIGKKLRNQQ